MTEVLHYTSGIADVKAGVETYILNLSSAMGKSEVSFTILTRNANVGSEGYKLLAESGIKIMDLDVHSLGVGTLPVYYRRLKSFFIENRGRYSFLHFHGCDDPFVVSAAQKYGGIKHVAVHAHSVSRENDRPLLNAYKSITSNININKAEYLFASCRDAGLARFKDRPFTVLNNTVDVDIYRYDESVRSEYRKRFRINDEILFCYVGRLVEIKNIPFLIKVFAEVCKRGLDAKLFIVGDGEYRPLVEAEVNTCGVADRIIVLGNRNDIPALLSMSDCYIQSSFSEGFSISVLEAQCSGAQLFLSDGFPKEVELTDLVHVMKLSDGPAIWADQIMKLICGRTESSRAREEYAGVIRKLGYDTVSNAEMMYAVYLHNGG